MVTLANIIIILSVCKIQSTINKLKLVFLHERYADIHLITFCLYYLIFMVQETINLISQFLREENGKFTSAGLKAHYSSIFVKNIYFVS